MKKTTQTAPQADPIPPGGTVISHSTISVGSYSPTPESAQAAQSLAEALKAQADALAHALKAQAEAVCAVAAMLTPPAMPNATGVKIGQ